MRKTILSLDFCQINKVQANLQFTDFTNGVCTSNTLCWVEHFWRCVAGLPLVAYKTNFSQNEEQMALQPSSPLSLCFCFMFQLQTELVIFWLWFRASPPVSCMKSYQHGRLMALLMRGRSKDPQTQRSKCHIALKYTFFCFNSQKQKRPAMLSP